jgi:hypothetical protein
MDGGSKAGPGGFFRRQMNPWGMGMARGGFPGLQARQGGGPDMAGGAIAQGSTPGLQAILPQIASQSMASEGRQQPAAISPTQQAPWSPAPVAQQQPQRFNPSLPLMNVPAPYAQNTMSIQQLLQSLGRLGQ